MKRKILVMLAALGLVMAPAMSTQAAWNADGNGWWYSHEDGGYAANQWEQINGTWYHFDGTGYMQTGWQFIDGAWYYMDGSGAMAANQWIGNYYVDGSGRMVTNAWIGSYYVGGDGAWIPGYGAAQWILDGNGWWYRHGDGGYTTNGWEQINGTWYLFDGSGYMKTGWQNVGGTWYFLHNSGAMAANQWIGKYYVDGSGAMLVNSWTPDGYYVNEIGVWTPQWHEPVYDSKWVVDKEAWTETKPVIEQQTHDICYCGFDLTQAYLDKYGEDAFVEFYETAGPNDLNEHYGNFVYTHVDGTDGHHGFRSSNITYPIITGYETVEHPEEGHWDKTLITEGYWK